MIKLGCEIMLKRFSKGTIILVLVLTVGMLFNVALFAKGPNDGPNRGWVDDWIPAFGNSLGFTGNVHFVPAHNDSNFGGLHVIQGWGEFINTSNDGKFYSEKAKSPYESKLYHKYKRVLDRLAFNQPKAVYNHGFKVS